MKPIALSLPCQSLRRPINALKKHPMYSPMKKTSSASLSAKPLLRTRRQALSICGYAPILHRRSMPLIWPWFQISFSARMSAQGAAPASTILSGLSTQSRPNGYWRRRNCRALRAVQCRAICICSPKMARCLPHRQPDRSAAAASRIGNKGTENVDIYKVRLAGIAPHYRRRRHFF